MRSTRIPESRERPTRAELRLRSERITRVLIATLAALCVAFGAVLVGRWL